MGIWEFDTWEMEDLERAKKLLDELAGLDLPYGIDPDGLAELNDELELRLGKIHDNMIGDNLKSLS